MLYCVLSFNFEGDHNISLHCLNSDLEKSKYIYMILESRLNVNNKKFLELVSIPDDFFSESGFQFFGRNRKDSKVIVIQSNHN